ncbi:MAG: glutathione S-transferase N-terminal domain-containing protein [Paraglaciecola polaris]|uniref:glutathione S-transferase family protein n=1 Tax=Paraglaciecola polaris TaxID=222814 RepID=UPI0030026BB7|tara:strand:+ start:1577 stop:2239 length:663 start_codon:yes stop_codon:yes gene_type:complete
MLKLYGFDVSNYFNMIKLALAYKGLDYQVEVVYPNQEPEFLTKSPMGKVPALETEDGMIVETNIIMEYLDVKYPDKPLYPADPFAQARVKELVKFIELYLELPARRCHQEAFFGSKVSDETRKDVKRALFRGMTGLNRLASFSPYVAGEEFSAADIMFLYSVDLASSVAKKLFEIDLLEGSNGAKALMAKLNELPEVQKIAADRKTANKAFVEYVTSFQK